MYCSGEIKHMLNVCKQQLLALLHRPKSLNSASIKPVGADFLSTVKVSGAKKHETLIHMQDDVFEN